MFFKIPVLKISPRFHELVFCKKHQNVASHSRYEIHVTVISIIFVKKFKKKILLKNFFKKINW